MLHRDNAAGVSAAGARAALGLLLPAIVLAAATPAVGQCVLDWSDQFNPPGVGDYLDSVECLFVWDGPHGAELLVGGNFQTAGKVYAPHLARYDGQAFAPFTLKPISYNPPYSPLTGNVRSAAVFDDGRGPALYLAGDFAPTKWDGRAFTRLGFGVGDSPPSEVDILAVYDDGAGPALYYGGNFKQIGPQRIDAYSIAKWDGHAWHDLDGGLYITSLDIPEVYALAVYDPPGPQGPGLYVGGRFSRARRSGEYLTNIARWDASGWSPLADGLAAPGYLVPSTVFALAAHDDGRGPALFAGGDFTSASGAPALAVARWDGQQWEALGAGISIYGGQASVYALAGAADGSLYAGGDFTTAGGQPAMSIAAWDGAAWSAVGEGTTPYPKPVYALALYDDGAGPQLYAGGRFDGIGGQVAANIARWDGQAWSALVTGQGLGNPPSDLAWFDDGNGPSLYATTYTFAGMEPVRGLARWDGQRWWTVVENPTIGVSRLAVWDDGAGPALYVGRTSVNTILTRLEGHELITLGQALPQPGEVKTEVNAILPFDDGTGEALYCAGRFTSVNGLFGTDNIAKWDGQQWHALGSGLDPSVYVNVLCVHDDGAGPALYLAGYRRALGFPAYIVRWDGNMFQELPIGFAGPRPEITTLASWPGPAGPELYAGIYMLDSVGGVPAHGIAIWDGSQWRPFPASPVPFTVSTWIRSLHVHGRGTGQRMFILGGGYDERAHTSIWDGTNLLDWAEASYGQSYEIVITDSASGLQGFLSGNLNLAGGKVVSNITSFRCLSGLTVGDVNCDGVVDGEDIDPFVLALTKPDLYAQHFPGCDIRTADCNYDWRVDNEDIDAFLQLLMGP